MKINRFAIRAMRDALRQLLPSDWEPAGDEPQITATKDGPDDGRIAVVFRIRRRASIDRTHLERR